MAAKRDWLMEALHGEVAGYPLAVKWIRARQALKMCASFTRMRCCLRQPRKELRCKACLAYDLSVCREKLRPVQRSGLEEPARLAAWRLLRKYMNCPTTAIIKMNTLTATNTQFSTR